MLKITLLIIYKDGEQKLVEGVSKYGLCPENEKILFFRKNGYESYIPIGEIKFFGREFDYEGK